MFQVYQLAKEAGWNYVDCSIEKTERGLELEVGIGPWARAYPEYYMVTRLLDPSFNYNDNIFQEIACELRGILIEYSHINPGRGL